MAPLMEQDPRVANTLVADVLPEPKVRHAGPSPPPVSTLRGSIEATQIGRFCILHKIGAGGMGVVYAAYDETLDRKVAIKLLHARGTLPKSERLRQEAQVMARISHPNVVQIYDVGDHGGQLYVAMEFLDGVPLSRWMTEALPGWSDTIAMFMQAGRGLQAAHDAGVVHRDFKPKSECPPQTPPLPPSGRILADRGDLKGAVCRVMPRHAAVLATDWQYSEVRSSRRCPEPAGG